MQNLTRNRVYDVILRLPIFYGNFSTVKLAKFSGEHAQTELLAITGSCRQTHLRASQYVDCKFYFTECTFPEHSSDEVVRNFLVGLDRQGVSSGLEKPLHASLNVLSECFTAVTIFVTVRTFLR